MAKNYKTPIKAMRAKCLDCCCGSPKEVRLCPVIECALYPYRFGRRPTKAILDTIKEFYAENVKPIVGLK
ncbi:uncharacterized protein METZ01_LOCUS490194 [marine metagenome]|uniref:Uncharacterized protein n=1 Tax=marine metagenome TaxID=408172 RepID=A0A383CZ71_9ZZZZ